MLIIIQFIFVLKIKISFKILFLDIQTLTNLKIEITDRYYNLMINCLNYRYWYCDIFCVPIYFYGLFRLVTYTWCNSKVYGTFRFFKLIVLIVKKSIVKTAKVTQSDVFSPAMLYKVKHFGIFSPATLWKAWHSNVLSLSTYFD